MSFHFVACTIGLFSLVTSVVGGCWGCWGWAPKGTIAPGVPPNKELVAPKEGAEAAPNREGVPAAPKRDDPELAAPKREGALVAPNSDEELAAPKREGVLLAPPKSDGVLAAPKSDGVLAAPNAGLACGGVPPNAVGVEPKPRAGVAGVPNPGVDAGLASKLKTIGPIQWPKNLAQGESVQEQLSPVARGAPSYAHQWHIRTTTRTRLLCTCNVKSKYVTSL